MLSVTSVIVYSVYLISIYFVVFWLSVLFQKGSIEDKTKELKNNPLVTIAIPVYNENKTIKRTIQSAMGLDYPKDKIEIIVINDGSTDNTAEIVEKIIKENSVSNIKLINQRNSGKGKALNNAIKKSKGEFFVCLDADSFVKEDALKKMLPEFEDQEVAIVLPLMKVKDPKNIVEKIQWYEYLINFFYKKLMAKLDCVHVSPGPFSVYKKKVLEKIGNFDEDNLTEDLEITLRAQKHHYKIVQVLSTEVYTYAPKTIKAFYKQRRRWYKGTILNIIKHKDMMFNSNYGDFGIMQLPSVLLSGVMILSIILITLYNYLLKPLYNRIYDLSFVDYDFLYFTNKWFQDFWILDINIVNIFFGTVIFILSISIIILANKYSKEKTFRYGILTMPAYILFYGLLLFGTWFGVVIEFLVGKKQKW